MKKVENKNSGLPLFIIIGVLVLVVAGAYLLYNRAPSANNGNRAANTANTNRAANTASIPRGAEPPNMMGSPTAAVTVEEFADFQCGACASVHPVVKELNSIYGSRIRFIFRNFPLNIPQHDKAYNAALAVESAGMQDRSKFWALQDQLMNKQQEWTANPNYLELWYGYAQRVGLDVDRLKADMAGTAAKKRVEDDLARGRALGVDSTPTLLVNGRPIPLQGINVSNLRQVIDAEIQAASVRANSNASGQAASPSGGAANGQ